MEYPDQGSQFQSFEHNSSQPAMFTEINMGPFNTPEQHYYNKSSLNVPPPQAYQAQSYTGASNSHGLTQVKLFCKCKTFQLQ
ncbi:hypothetical protein L596_014605 [Steinernema carpocapsae]|uniref:Uncharacterized protein n=1 Tax=Steinernema carpocapsae TaxID=34508 RepID=A0A4U5NCE2_STECR|nr:hypothetical protein L596_014605 [Steinernema carpocapsae]